MNFLGYCLYSDANPAALAGSLWPDFAFRPSEESGSPESVTSSVDASEYKNFLPLSCIHFGVTDSELF
ncbi:MAG: hypothetical protein P8X79_20730 [Reinekea sp.]